MTIEQAIQKAIEGGYKGWYQCCDNCGGSGGVPPEYSCSKCFGTGDMGEPMVMEMAEDGRCFMEPSFWQCLGKAMGWGWTREDPMISLDIGVKFFYEKEARSVNEMIVRGMDETKIKYELSKYLTHVKGQDWLYHWYRFIDALADGKTIEQFFQEL